VRGGWATCGRLALALSGVDSVHRTASQGPALANAVASWPVRIEILVGGNVATSVARSFKMGGVLALLMVLLSLSLSLSLWLARSRHWW